MPQTSELDEVVNEVFDLKAALEALPSSSRLSNVDANAIYALAYNLVVQGRHEAAYRYFSLLTLYQPTNVDYLVGLANSYRMLEHFAEALNVYSFLAVIDPEQPEHTLAIAECLLLQKEVQEARDTVAMVLRYCDQNASQLGTTDKVRDRALVISQLIAGEVETA